MKKLFLAIALLLSNSAAIADAGIRYAPLGYCQLTSLGSSTLVSSCSGFPASATTAVIRTETQSVRWRDDGTAPTSSAGMLMLAADAPYVYTGAISKLRFIEVTSGAKLNILFYK